MGGQRVMYQSTWQIVSQFQENPGERRLFQIITRGFNIFPQVVVALMIIGSDHPTRGDKVSKAISKC